jgi:hypothetical protein
MENKYLFGKQGSAFITIIITIFFLFQCCHFTPVYFNKEEDQIDGKVFLITFYNSIKTQNYNAIYKLTSDTLREVIGRDSLNKMYSRINFKIGAFRNYSITKFFIQRDEGRDTITTYSYKLKVTYEKGKVDEIIGLRKQNKDSIKIISYKVYSDLLIR